MLSSSCSTSDTRRVTVERHEHHLTKQLCLLAQMNYCLMLKTHCSTSISKTQASRCTSMEIEYKIKPILFKVHITRKCNERTDRRANSVLDKR
jgi:hypothetical protein